MADEIPIDTGSPGDLYQDSDQDDAMDTASEAGGVLQGISARIQHDPDVDSSVQMDMSDNEDFDDEQPKPRSPDSPAMKATEELQEPAPVMQEISKKPSSPNVLDVVAPTQPPTEYRAALPKVIKDPVSVPVDSIQDIRQPVYELTLPIWQRILSFIPPVMLGRLSSTSRLFHAVLAPRTTKEKKFQTKFTKIPMFLPADQIWRVSRTLFAPELPKPLKDRSESDMWRLIRGRSCQICNQVKPLLNTQDMPNPWHAGPGIHGLRIFWHLGIRACGVCIPQRCQQDVSLQLSSTFPSFLIEALPALFLSQHNDWIAELTLLRHPPPPDLQIKKLFYQPHIDAILKQYKDVRELGEAAEEEWAKGLSRQRIDKLADATRWEQWEVKGGLKKLTSRSEIRLPIAMPTHIPVQPIVGGFPPFNGPPQTPFPGPPNFNMPLPPFHMQGPPSAPPMEFRGPPQLGPGPQGPPPPINMPMNGPPPGFSQFPQQNGPVPSSGASVAHGRPRRSLQEVNEARAARRYEIERRAAQLEPPINPRVLAHMQSFQAALQISFPFTDRDWELLLPRLLMQRADAEAHEATIAEQLRVIQAKVAKPSPEALLARDPNELNDTEWDILQAPVRDILGKLAQERIKEAWNGGSSITRDTAAQFVADVLLTVRDRYRASLNQPLIDNTPLRLRIPLSLENIKWLYDNKVKGLAEIYHKELFQCNGCEGNAKYYGFEGVIQHYAAKHTTALSLGNIIVNWRTEWPDISPFQTYMGTDENEDSNGGINYAEAFPPPPFAHAGYPGHTPQYPSQQNETQSGKSTQAQKNGAATHPGSSGTHSSFLDNLSVNDGNLQKLTDMAQNSRELWNATMGIKELPASVRIYVLVYHMSKRFEKKFSTSPDISMFLHGLNENAQMRPIRSLNGMTCKACLSTNHGYSNGFSDHRKSFTLPALINHFKNVHLASADMDEDAGALDWRVDMVELPSEEGIKDLIVSGGMDERKFQLIAEAFPEAFPQPLTPLITIKEERAKVIAERVKEEAAKSKLDPAQVRLEALKALEFGIKEPVRHVSLAGMNSSKGDTQQVSYGQRPPSRSPFGSDSGPVEPPGEDEYDPSKPLFFGTIVEHGRRPQSAEHKPVMYALPPGIVSLGVVDSHGVPESPHGDGGYADRLLRHQRGSGRRGDIDVSSRDSYGVQTPTTASYTPFAQGPDKSAADKFLSDLAINDAAPSVNAQNREAFASNVYYSTGTTQQVRYDGGVQAMQADERYLTSTPQYGYPQAEYRGPPAGEDLRYNSRAMEVDAHQVQAAPHDRYYDPHAAAQGYPPAPRYASRDRSRSPRRSIPREYAPFDPATGRVAYEPRPESRWRGESPPRDARYRANYPEDYTQQSFVGRDAQGRSVRYVAVPVDDYEAPAARYPVAPPAYGAPPPIMTRPGEMVEAGPDGRLYLVDQPGSVRYGAEAMDPARYREYR